MTALGQTVTCLRDLKLPEGGARGARRFFDPCMCLWFLNTNESYVIKHSRNITMRIRYFHMMMMLHYLKMYTQKLLFGVCNGQE